MNDNKTVYMYRELVWRSSSVMDCTCDDPGFNTWWVRCINRASRPSQGTVNGGAVSNDLADDGT